MTSSIAQTGPTYPLSPPHYPSGSARELSPTERAEQAGVKTMAGQGRDGSPANRLPVVDKSKVDPAMIKAAEGMEAMFLDYMMKVMRESIPKNELDLSNQGTEIFQGMLDSEIAQKAAHTRGIGLSDLIIAYMEGERHNLPTGQLNAPAGQQPHVSTGGTDEGRGNKQ